MMDTPQRANALAQMQAVSDQFYANAVAIGCHPFIEFTGLLNEYISACRDAHANGIDFTECNIHSGLHLPLKSHQVSYLNEKLGCIFNGQSVIDTTHKEQHQTT